MAIFMGRFSQTGILPPHVPATGFLLACRLLLPAPARDRAVAAAAGADGGVRAGPRLFLLGHRGEHRVRLARIDRLDRKPLAWLARAGARQPQERARAAARDLRRDARAGRPGAVPGVGAD